MQAISVPYIAERRIELDAELLLMHYQQKAGTVVVPPVPIDEIAETFLELTLDFLDMQAMFPFADVHGAIWFREKRIGIDQSLDPHDQPKRLGRYRFTLAHEVGHWQLHRQHFLKNTTQKSLFDCQATGPDVVCRSSHTSVPVEVQANQFAACLLMPRKLIRMAWAEFRGDDDSPIAMSELRNGYLKANDTRQWFHHGQVARDQESQDLAMKEDFCRPLAEIFQVSPEAMRIRVEQMKLLVARKPSSLF